MTGWEIVGWSANACFFTRFLVQWIASERARTSVAPRVFWQLSVLGAIAICAYSLHREQYVLLVGNAIDGSIFARNLWIAHRGESTRRFAPGPAALVGLVAVATLAWAAWRTLHGDTPQAPVWVLCVFVGQTLWSSRFVIQWWYTEHRGYSHFPRVFWWISLCGNTLLLAYALKLGDPVYVAGFLLGPLVQIRNLLLGQRLPADPPAER